MEKEEGNIYDIRKGGGVNHYKINFTWYSH